MAHRHWIYRCKGGVQDEGRRKAGYEPTDALSVLAFVFDAEPERTITARRAGMLPAPSSMSLSNAGDGAHRSADKASRTTARARLAVFF
ncbi:hypothetical protein [Paraburkholderia sediminicola]|uniref:hypothetical protein n=1 Tax=Paraburkholderia sediminicola TaxID=458836 RepID=UPI0038BDAB93